MLACCYKKNDIVDLLIRKRGSSLSLDLKSKDGNTALILCTMSANREGAEMLIGAGTDKDARGMKRWTADRWVEKVGHSPDVVVDIRKVLVR